MYKPRTGRNTKTAREQAGVSSEYCLDVVKLVALHLALDWEKQQGTFAFG